MMNKEKKEQTETQLLNVIGKLLNVIVCLMLFCGALVYVNFFGIPEIFLSAKKVISDEISASPSKNNITTVSDLWVAPDTSKIPNDAEGKLIRYGRMLIVNTAYYLGPSGIIQHTSNGMNCQNCHLDAGTKPFGNNYSAVASTYPKFRERSGKVESIYKRINDCIERSLNGTTLDSACNEMQAMKAYIVWLGKDIVKGKKPKGSGLTELAFPDKAADPSEGKLVYVSKCQSCHNKDGEGKMNADNITYQYPPLWGDHSYNTGAGLFRLTRFAGYVKSNMPFGACYDKPQLTDEEAWNVAAFINSQQRPIKDLEKDWPKISGKPIDHPFGPYADNFNETQHKFGPFGPIDEFKKQQKAKEKKTESKGAAIAKP